jgi:hypothetical protein
VLFSHSHCWSVEILLPIHAPLHKRLVRLLPLQSRTISWSEKNGTHRLSPLALNFHFQINPYYLYLHPHFFSKKKKFESYSHYSNSACLFFYIHQIQIFFPDRSRLPLDIALNKCKLCPLNSIAAFTTEKRLAFLPPRFLGPKIQII